MAISNFFHRYLLVLFVMLSGTLLAETLPTENIKLPNINVPGDNLINGGLIYGAEINGDYLDSRRLMTSDSATLLDGVPGVSFYTGGGVSSLPVIEGLADDRINIKVDGVPITSACPNHMNPALSYIDPSNVGKINLFAGITPVSQGGDSIAGSISIRSKDPKFAEPGQGNIVRGSVSGFYRSNGNVRGANANASFASENFSIGYSGNTVESDNYEDGHGNKVKSTEYKVRNNLVNIATRSGNHQFGLNIGWQDIPYQAYVNQAMDMTSNKSISFNADYKGFYDWGLLEARIYRQRVRHKMDMLSDKAGQMPMDTRAVDTGYSVQGTMQLSQRDSLKLGHEYHHYTLDDWWPPLSSGFMSPNNFWNISDGKRDRLALFGELESRWNEKWTSQLGARLERVYMNTGNVQGYFNTGDNTYLGYDSCMGMCGPLSDGYFYANDAVNFNSKSHKKTDYNLDITAAAQYEVNKNETFDFGFSRKVRSPNMHERYTWSSEMMMAGLMNNWFGDLNSYVGNLNLEPEVAYTLKVSGDWHDEARKSWQLKLTPFYTYVQDFINVKNLNMMEITSMNMNGGQNLTFINHDAYLYGIDASGKKYIGNFSGDWTTRASVNYVRGKSTDGTNLYNIMPLNAKFAVDHSLGSWTNTAEVVAIRNKEDIDSVRNERKVSGYAIVNFRTNYKWNETVRLDASIDNLFDKFYQLPLGGLEYAGSYANQPTRAMGRSANVGMTINF